MLSWAVKSLEHSRPGIAANREDVERRRGDTSLPDDTETRQRGAHTSAQVGRAKVRIATLGDSGISMAKLIGYNAHLDTDQSRQGWLRAP